MTITSRKAWGAKPSKSAKQKMTMPAVGSYLHHTVTKMPANYLKVSKVQQVEMEKAHMRFLQGIAFSRGFADISYNFIIFPSGRVYQGRGWGVVGAHTEGSNSTTHAFAFVGNFETDRPTLAALETAAELHRRGKDHGRIRPRGWLKGHRDAPGAQTACPGKHLYAQLDKVRRLSRR